MPKGKLTRLLSAKMIHSARTTSSKPLRRRVCDAACVLRSSGMGGSDADEFRSRCIDRASLRLISHSALAIVPHVRSKIVTRSLPRLFTSYWGCTYGERQYRFDDFLLDCCWYVMNGPLWFWGMEPRRRVPRSS